MQRERSPSMAEDYWNSLPRWVKRLNFIILLPVVFAHLVFVFTDWLDVWWLKVAIGVGVLVSILHTAAIAKIYIKMEH
jgi:hypothetical protein